MSQLLEKVKELSGLEDKKAKEVIEMVIKHLQDSSVIKIDQTIIDTLVDGKVGRDSLADPDTNFMTDPSGHLNKL